MTDNVIDLTTPGERDQQVLGLRLAGIAPARIGRELGLKPAEVMAALQRTLPVVDAAYRGRVLQEELSRLDQLQAWWYGAAKTSSSAALLCLRIAERRSALLGLDAPQHVRMDPIQVVAGAQPQESSTQTLLRELNRIAAERQPGEVIIESEAERDAGCPAPELPKEPPPAA